MPATSASPDDRCSGTPPYRRDVNTVFQAYALFPHMSVAENVAYGLQQRRTPKSEIREQVAEALDLVQMRTLRRPQAHAALGRPAAARRARPRAREPPLGAAARRAARRARPAAARRDAARAEAAAVAPRHHVRVRHARPGRGALDERPHRDHARRPHRAARRRRHRVRPARLRVRRGVRRPAELLPRHRRRGRTRGRLARTRSCAACVRRSPMASAGRLRCAPRSFASKRMSRGAPSDARQCRPRRA